LTAVATDNQDHKRTSNTVRIKVGTPAMAKLEAEARLDPGRLLFSVMQRQATLVCECNRPARLPGSFLACQPEATRSCSVQIAFRHPKTQYINVNGTRVAEIVFDGSLNVWREKSSLLIWLKETTSFKWNCFGAGWISIT
jgi:hypothetical protein